MPAKGLDHQSGKAAVARFSQIRSRESFGAYHVRLAGVIERLPYVDPIKRCDRPEMLFFIDPPYVGSEDYYGTFGQEDFQRLADLLGRIAGRFMLTVNDCFLACKVVGRFIVKTKTLNYTMVGGVKRLKS